MVVNNKWESLHFALAGDVQAGRLAVESITWSGMTTDGDTMTMKNSAGDIVFGPLESSTDFNPIVVTFPSGKLFNGLEVDILDSGVVDVVLR